MTFDVPPAISPLTLWNTGHLPPPRPYPNVSIADICRLPPYITLTLHRPLTQDRGQISWGKCPDTNSLRHDRRLRSKHRSVRRKPTPRASMQKKSLSRREIEWNIYDCRTIAKSVVAIVPGKVVNRTENRRSRLSRNFNDRNRSLQFPTGSVNDKCAKHQNFVTVY